MDVKQQEERNENVRKRMLDVLSVKVEPCPTNSPWVRPVRMHYVQDGVQKEWDAIRAHDGVSIIIFNTSRKKLVFVKQFRPAAYYYFLPTELGPIDLERFPPSLGLTLELCAGIVDKDKPLVEIARDELKEECGYEVPSEALKKIVTYRHVATSVSWQTLFYAEVTDAMRVHPGGGAESEGELIEVVELSVPEIKKYISTEEVQSPVSFLYGVTWFLANKPEHCS